MAGQGLEDDDDRQQVVVVMVPFPFQSHLNQLLNLSHRLASYNIPIHYVGSTTFNHQVRHRHHTSTSTTTTTTTSAANDLIHFHDFQLPPLSYPLFLESLISILAALRRHIFHLLQELTPNFRRLIVIHDSLMTSSIEDVRTIPNAESYAFYPFSPFFIFFNYWEKTPDEEKPFQLDLHLQNISKFVPFSEWCSFPEFKDFADKQFKLSEEFESGRVYNTSRIIEGEYVELLEKIQVQVKHHFAIGPFNPVEVSVKNSHNKCIKWLDQKEKDSVIYVSFGTTTSLSNDQIRELEIGLMRSGQSFLLVVRNPDYVLRDEDDQVVIEEFEEKGSGGKVGIVVRETWVPQLEILAHPATGGFMTHCGWGSCIESITMGVPVAAWQIHSDQPKNSALVAHVLKMGVVVREWGDQAELVSSTTVEKVVRRLMASEEGDEMRKRATELSKSLRESFYSGASEMDTFVAHISR